MIELQYDLFVPIPDELTELRQELRQVQLSLDKQRKSQFAKIGAAGKEIIELKEEQHRIRFELDAVRKMIAIT